MNEQPKQFKWVGTRTIRPDGVDKVTGRAKFGADLSLPGMLEGSPGMSGPKTEHFVIQSFGDGPSKVFMRL